MSMTITLPAATEAALRAEADIQGRPADDIIAEALVHYWQSAEHGVDVAESVAEEDPAAVAEMEAAFAALEEAEQSGTPLLTVEELEAELDALADARSVARSARKAA